jgi:prepilin-type N-terminal cleavage/methylation domain-containing protein
MKKAAHFRSGLTFIELLIVIAIIGIICTFPILMSWRTTRSNQALVTSAENFANQVKTAHIYAREVKDSKAWGVESDTENSFNLISSTLAGWTTVSTFQLESQVKFDQTFSILFNRGTGEIASDASVELKNIIGKKVRIDVAKTGLVEVSAIY